MSTNICRRCGCEFQCCIGAVALSVEVCTEKKGDSIWEFKGTGEIFLCAECAGPVREVIKPLPKLGEDRLTKG